MRIFDYFKKVAKTADDLDKAINNMGCSTECQDDCTHIVDSDSGCELLDVVDSLKSKQKQAKELQVKIDSIQQPSAEDICGLYKFIETCKRIGAIDRLYYYRSSDYAVSMITSIMMGVLQTMSEDEVKHLANNIISLKNHDLILAQKQSELKIIREDIRKLKEKLEID